ncbi:MAG: tRNA (guanosine(46)-N7)-methyltransferase TrmB [Myxococcales bacterium]|nr:tRNA (guanosine(46)-N7)-methyltransferase TrmB [Myxococcales bacterium]
MARRVRKHANPFNVDVRLERLVQEQLFGKKAALEVDVGCGAGDYILQRAITHPESNFLGFEIRKPLVEAALARARAKGVRNVWYFYANIHDNYDFFPLGEVSRFCIQFPDPCFKKKHWKRRILHPLFVRQMGKLLPIGGEIFAQSDVHPLAEEMYTFLDAECAIKSILPPDLRAPNPFPERTEWERHHETENEPVYRMLFRKITEPSGDIPKIPFRDTNPLRASSPNSEIDRILGPYSHQNNGKDHLI